MAKKKENALEGEVVKLAGDFLTGGIKRKIVRFGEASVLVIISFLMISIGIAKLIGFYFPLLDNGLNYIILGIIFLLSSMMLRV